MPTPAAWSFSMRSYPDAAGYSQDTRARSAGRFWYRPQSDDGGSPAAVSGKSRTRPAHTRLRLSHHALPYHLEGSLGRPRRRGRLETFSPPQGTENPAAVPICGGRGLGDQLASSLTSFSDEARIALDTIAGRATGLLSPSLRLGVTGLSRAGKTVFITALVHNLIHGGRLPLFEAQKSGRIARAFLEHQPDDAVPRFQYEDHVRGPRDERVCPIPRAPSRNSGSPSNTNRHPAGAHVLGRPAVGGHRRLSR